MFICHGEYHSARFGQPSNSVHKAASSSERIAVRDMEIIVNAVREPSRRFKVQGRTGKIQAKMRFRVEPAKFRKEQYKRRFAEASR